MRKSECGRLCLKGCEEKKGGGPRVDAFHDGPAFVFMLLSILALGFVLGLQHALEADHLAAVSTIASRRRGVRPIVRHGVAWGVGHTLMLLAVAGSALVLGLAISPRLEALFEFLVGLMLMGLGGHLVYRLWRERVHIHVHRHADGTVHLHAHSHAGEPRTHDGSKHHAHHPHEHAHPHREGPPWRTLGVGLMHGLAGSGALIVLAASASATAPLMALAYVLVFGLGSIVGMALLSAVIAVPITLSARILTGAHRALQVAIAMVTIAIGATIAAETRAALWAPPAASSADEAAASPGQQTHQGEKTTVRFAK